MDSTFVDKMKSMFSDYPMYYNKHGVILKGDNMEVMERLEEDHFDLLLTDPPYGIGEDGGANHDKDKITKIGGKTIHVKATNYTPKEWDSDIPPPQYFIESMRVSRNQMYFGGNYFQDVMVDGRPVLHATNAWVIWDKQINGQFSDTEMCWTSFDKANKIYRVMWNGFLRDDKKKEDRFHPTQKPVKLMRYILRDYAEKGQTVLDTHAGSCSTAIAAIDLDMNFLMVELDDEYFEKAVDRVDYFKYGYNSKLKGGNKELPQATIKFD